MPDELLVDAALELPRFRGHLSVWGEMIAREMSDAENETALPAGLPREAGTLRRWAVGAPDCRAALAGWLAMLDAGTLAVSDDEQRSAAREVRQVANQLWAA